jgi:hypothetical protein
LGTLCGGRAEPAGGGILHKPPGSRPRRRGGHSKQGAGRTRQPAGGQGYWSPGRGQKNSRCPLVEGPTTDIRREVRAYALLDVFRGSSSSISVNCADQCSLSYAFSEFFRGHSSLPPFFSSIRVHLWFHFPCVPFGPSCGQLNFSVSVLFLLVSLAAPPTTYVNISHNTFDTA